MTTEETVPVNETIESGRAWRLTGSLLGGVVLLCFLSLLLPHDRYMRFKQFENADVFKLRWDYERIHFDPTPIDVAIIGSSRVEAALSAPELAAALSAKLGRPVNVANLAVPLEGRNLHYVLAKELLACHPETKIILLSVVERADITHPAFKYVADVRDVLQAPWFISHYYMADAAFLPYRQMSYFAQTIFARWFGESNTYPGDYYGTGFDTTKSFRIPNGHLIDRYLVAPPQKLDADVKEFKAGLVNTDGYWIQRSAWYALNEPLEPAYTARLASLAKQHGTLLVFVHLPFYSSRPGQYDHGQYEKLGPLLDAQQFSGNARYYADAVHFNRYGIEKVSPWLASAIDPYTDVLRSTNISHNKSESLTSHPVSSIY